MTQSEKINVGKMVEACAAMFNRGTSKAMVSLYVDALEEYDFEDVAAAFRSYLTGAKGKYFPMPAHIVEQIQDEGDSEAEAAMALSRYTGGARFPSDDAITNRVIVSLGGQYDCKMMPAGVFSGLFRKTYTALHRAGKRKELEITNGFLGPGENVPMLGNSGSALNLERRLELLNGGDVDHDDDDFGPEIGDEETSDLDGNVKGLAESMRAKL